MPQNDGARTPDPRALATPAPDVGPVASAPLGPPSGRADRPDSYWAAVGGSETFRRLVDRFYEGVATDPVLRPMYPEEDLAGARERLTLFLEQYWGGPTTYSDTRGHPRLRLRHSPFAVTPDARDRWLAHMRDAVAALDLPPARAAVLWDYLERAAYSMVNTRAEP